MQDRFKFRAVVKGYYEINLPNEYKEVEPLIILDNIDVLKNGEIGLMEDELETAIRGQHSNLNSAEISHILEFFNNNSNGIDDYVTITPEVICQCTGLKDKNGKLIYEGDVVKTTFTNNQKVTFMVVWNDETALFGGKIIKREGINSYFTINQDYLYYLLGDKEDKCEVLGNIYKNPELLEKSIF